MKLKIETPSQAILRKPSLLRHTPEAEKIKEFKDALKKYLSEINKEQLENVQKTYLLNFLNNGIYRKTNNINLNGDIDLAIHQDLKTDSKPVVLLEMKAPKNKNGMIAENDLNKTALHEMAYYYMNERAKENIFVKHCIITDYFKWYIFEAEIFEKEFNAPLKKDYNRFVNNQTLKGNTDEFYKKIAAPHVKESNAELPCVKIDFEQYKDFDKISEKELVELYKILSPYFLLNEQTHDANRLDERFYKELLHIVGLEEKTKDGKLIIDRKAKPDAGSLIENAIISFADKAHKIRVDSNFKNYKSDEDALFAVAFELCITWVNRILFLKLLEAQLVKYHTGDEAADFHFLNSNKISNYKSLANLFHQVLAKPVKDRSPIYRDKFINVPYLNSSLFDDDGLENNFQLHISNLEDEQPINLYSNSILADYKKADKPLNLLEYLFAFLNAYDFSTVNIELTRQSNKPLINASVLGKVFEKINGYKDGSIYTPSFITTYMCRESLRLAVLDKFKEAEPTWKINSFKEIRNYLINDKTSDAILRYNEIVNSIRICDPAVGSGHFLVSALNEMIAIKYDLGILADAQGKIEQNYEIILADDELVIKNNEGDFFEYKIKDGSPLNNKSQRMQKILFDEKRTIIEQCLFGVDININSVKICSLRLWIELLKNAYYIEEKNFTELETLPNIDINIKCGNSLVSRFELDADLSSLAKKSKQNNSGMPTLPINLRSNNLATSYIC